MWELRFVGLLAPRPRQHRMLHPKLRLTAQKKSNRKRKRSNAFSSVTPVFLFVIAPALRGAHNGSGPATARAWGRHQPPHESILTLFSKIISTRSYARKGIIWDATSHVAGGVGRAAPQNKSPTSKNLCASFPNILSCFFNVFCTFFMPVREQFGIKRPAFTWGHGGDASPHIQPHPLQTCAGLRLRCVR